MCSYKKFSVFYGAKMSHWETNNPKGWRYLKYNQPYLYNIKKINQTDEVNWEVGFGEFKN